MPKLPDSQTNLRRFDLNLLPILKALLSTHSVARSSEILGLSQSATSGALTRLRGMFGDPLLIQVGRNLVPTPRAVELKSYVEEAFGRLHDLFDQRPFDLEREDRCFVIATSDYVTGELAPALLRLITAEAPRVTVKFVAVSSSHWASMEGGDIDFQIAPQLGPQQSNIVLSRPLYEDEMVIVSSDRFCMPPEGLDLETYLASSHATYGVADSETFEDKTLAALGITQRNLVTVPQFNLLPELVRSVDCLAMIPRHAAERYREDYGLRIWPVPFNLQKMQISIYWSQLLDKNAAHIWCRDLIARAWDETRRAAE